MITKKEEERETEDRWEKSCIDVVYVMNKVLVCSAGDKDVQRQSLRRLLKQEEEFVDVYFFSG